MPHPIELAEQYKRVISRDLSAQENCSGRALKMGEEIYLYPGCTYGCISAGGVACTFVFDETPFFEVPEDSLSLIAQAKAEMPPVLIKQEYWFEVGPADRKQGVLGYGSLQDAEDLKKSYADTYPDRGEIQIRLQQRYPPLSGKDSAPLHPFELKINIGACNFAYAAQTLRELADHLEERGPDSNIDIASGCHNGNHSLICVRRDISADEFRRELTEWFDRRRKVVMA